MTKKQAYEAAIKAVRETQMADGVGAQEYETLDDIIHQLTDMAEEAK